ncbi:MAG: cell division protein ZipA C-terminal FtsZ-binding domain-containing protein [Gammaproteobacteria bacterium]|nr:cell division protein ZipA C-terminal FtsZ-binding domain-containing protein [Gammaproteobacteria bacterium]
MDALRWTLLIVAVLVIGGIYAWGRRGHIHAWWHGQRDDDSFRSDEEGEDVSDELQRLRDLMESEKDERPPRRTHTDRDADQFDYDLGIEVSAPRPVKSSRTGGDGERDVLLEAAAAKAATSKSGPLPPVSSPRVVASATSGKSRPALIEVGVPATKPEAVDFATGSESVSKPRVRPRVDEEQAVTTDVGEPISVEDAPVSYSNDAPLTGEQQIDGHMVDVDMQPEWKPEPAAPPVVMPHQNSLDLGDEQSSAPPPSAPPPNAPPVRRLDTVIVDGEIFDSQRHDQAADAASTGPNSDAESPDQRPASPGLSELGGRLMGWAKGLGEAVQARMPKRPEPPVKSTPELILVLHVMAPRGSHFSGDEVREALKSQKLTLGDNGLYQVLPAHRATTTPVVCVANMLEPGVLTDAELADLQTPGLSLFLRLPGPVEGVEALETLLTTAQAISRHLQGEMRDQARNRLTRQSISHMHEQVLEHARRMQIALSRKR